MKKTNIVKTLILISAIAGVSNINADEKTVFNGNLSTGYSNENFYRGADVGDETLKVGASVKGSLSNVGVFGSILSDQSINSGADQYYISAGVASSLFENNLDIAGGYLHRESKPGVAVGEVFSRLTGNILLSPSLIAYYNTDDKLWSTEVSVEHTFKHNLADLTLSALGGNTEVTSSNDRSYYVVGASLARSITDSVDVIASIDRIDPDDAKDETVFTVGIQLDF